MLDTHLLLLWLEIGKKQGTKKRKQEANRPCKKSQFNQSIDSRLRANGFPGQGRLIFSTHRARKELKAKRYSPNFIILPIFGPNRGSLWPIWRTRSQSKRETSLEERSSGSVFAVFLSDRFVRTCDLFFSSLVATLATKLFPATTKYLYCSESFPTRPSRDENQ